MRDESLLFIAGLIVGLAINDPYFNPFLQTLPSYNSHVKFYPNIKYKKEFNRRVK
jgi:hypothetical protein